MSSDIAHLPADLRRALTAELQPGERVFYAGRPDWRAEIGSLSGIAIFGFVWSLVSGTFFVFIFRALFGAEPIMMNGEPAAWYWPAFILLVLLPFLGFGITIFASPFLAILKSRGTVHAVTDTRLLNVHIGYDKGCDSHPLQTVNFIKRRDRRNGTGSLSIGYGTRRDSDGDVFALTLDWSGIPDAKRAEAAIRDHAHWAR